MTGGRSWRWLLLVGLTGVVAQSADPPRDAVVLLGSQDAGAWQSADGGPCPWPVVDGALVAQGGGVVSREVLGDCQVHLEFRCPRPTVGPAGGLWLLGRYGLLLRAPAAAAAGSAVCGALEGVAPPLVDAGGPAGSWQTVDLLFRAARRDAAGTVTEVPRLSALLNGQWIHDGLALPAGGAQPEADRGSLHLRDLGGQVQYRNVWARHLPAPPWREGGLATGPVTSPPPGGAVVLFDGQDASRLRSGSGGAVPWPVIDGALEVAAGKGNVYTREAYRDYQLHVEFQVPDLPRAKGQAKGNSGLKLNGVYEIQVLDSYGQAKPGVGDCGAVYSLRPPEVNACLPPATWQSFDLLWHSPRVAPDGRQVTPGRVSVLHNGLWVHDGQAVLKQTGAGRADRAVPQGPLMLQDHGHAVRYRNLWLRPWPVETAGG